MDYKELSELKCLKSLYEAKKFKEKLLTSGTKKGEKYCFEDDYKKSTKV